MKNYFSSRLSVHLTVSAHVFFPNKKRHKICKLKILLAQFDVAFLGIETMVFSESSFVLHVKFQRTLIKKKR